MENKTTSNTNEVSTHCLWAPENVALAAQIHIIRTYLSIVLNHRVLIFLNRIFF